MSSFCLFWVMHMLEYIKRGVIATLSFISSALGAVLGLFLYPLASLLRLVYSFISYSLSLALRIPILAVAAGFFLNIILGLDFLNAAIGSLFVVGALVGLTLGIMPLFFVISALRILISAPFRGINDGWRMGLFAVLSNTISILFAESVNTVLIPGVNAILPPRELFGIDGVDYHTLLQQLGEHAVDAARRPMTEEQYNACALTLTELRALRTNRLAPLTEDEVRHLETDHVILDKLGEYKNLKQRLERDQCSITQDRPEREDTILLVKQYKVGEHWLPVPGAATIFDKTSLKTYFVGTDVLRGDAIHPLTRNVILAPSSYQIAEVEHETRYVHHPFYVEGEGSDKPGLCQELNELTRCLRARVQTILAVGSDLDHAAAVPRSVWF